MPNPNPERPSRYIDAPRSVRPGTILTPSRDPFAEVMTFLRRLAKERFYGTCAVTLRDGEIQVVRTEQTIKIGDLPTASVLPPQTTLSTRNTGDNNNDNQY